MALSDFFEDCVLLDRRTQADQLAGLVETWVDGAELRLGIATNNSTAAQIAYQSGAKVMYTVVMTVDTALALGDRIRRKRDGLVLKLVSDPADMTTPSVAVEKFKQARAEAVRI